eukprot:3167403-Rhodomonas_salina.1
MPPPLPHIAPSSPTLTAHRPPPIRCLSSYLPCPRRPCCSPPSSRGAGPCTPPAPLLRVRARVQIVHVFRSMA